MVVKGSDLIEGLDWYWSRKNDARDAIVELKKDNLSLARRLYGEYFIYLVSALEVVNDFAGGFDEQVRKALEKYGHTGHNNYEYLRLLRHCVIHRGEDLVYSGAPTEASFNPIAPKQLHTKNGKKVFFRFSPYLNGIIFICELELGVLIDSYLGEAGVWSVEALSREAERRAKQLIVELEHMPCELKPMAIDAALSELRSKRPWEATIPVIRTKLTEAFTEKAEVDSFITLSEANWKGRICRCANCS